ncbi:MAG TPA: histidine kinase dimerization/phosphoacceptor domain -containing protein [Methanocella sp.]|nr:histidine kinase dimerization/phosphoacceptor domain -containing protein [Methanocella sp.]
MINGSTRAKGFNTFQALLIALWVAVLFFIISAFMVSFLNGAFTTFSAIAATSMALLALPLSISIHRVTRGQDLRRVTMGLVGFVAIIVASGVLAYVIPSTFNLPLMAYISQLLWYIAYAVIIIPLYLQLKLQRKALDDKINILLTAVCVIASLIIAYSIVVESPKLAINSFNILFYTITVILDIVLLMILSKLMLINMPNKYRYLFGILFIFFFMLFIPDVNNLFTFYQIDTMASPTYSNPISMLFYGLSDVFLAISLMLYSSRNMDMETVEEVRETLQDTRYLMNDIIARSPDPICLCDSGGYALMANDLFLDTFSVSRSAAMTRANILDGTLAMGLMEEDRDKLKKLETVAIPELKSPDGKRFLAIKIFPTYTSHYTHSGFIVKVEDITERTLAEKQVKDSLEAKNLLLKEMHHRVKNNFQIISSLLSVQASSIVDKKALECLTESGNRVKTMALIHEKLYESESLSGVNFSEYIDNLASSLFSSYNISPEKIHMDLQMDDITLGVDKAVPCGLLINELVTNSLKHAFPDDRSGEVHIRMHRAGNLYVLEIDDDGVGFPAGTDYRHTTSLGMQLVNLLVNQIYGTIELEGGKGTRFRITFSG